MNTNSHTSSIPHTDSKATVINEIRKLAIVVAIGAIGYVAVDNLTSRSASSDSITTQSTSKVAQSDLKDLPVQKQSIPLSDASDTSSEVPTHLIVQEVKTRVSEVKGSPQVILRSAAAREEMAAARTAPQTYTQSTAQASRAPSTTASGSQPLPIIGFYQDGSAMPESERREQVKHLLSQIPRDFTINWDADQEVAAIYVFTDPTCPYCKRLHDAVPELNAAGISVRYFMYPRDLPNSSDGVLSPTATQLANAWCSVDQKQAVDDAFAGYRLPNANCSDLPEELGRSEPPISDHYMLGTLFDVKGTPTMATTHGQVIEGFSNAQALISRIMNQQ